MLGTAADSSGTAVEETSSPSEEVIPEPETEVVAETPETEEAEAPETEELTLEDDRVKELLRGELAKKDESFRRREENARKEAQQAAYNEQRQAAQNYRVENAHAQVGAMIKAATEEGQEPDSRALAEILTQVSIGGLFDTLDGMEGLMNGFLQEDNPKFFQSIPAELNQSWVDATMSRDPGQVVAAALKIAAASGEARGWNTGQEAAFKALDARTKEKAKTKSIQKASETRSAEGVPATGLSGGSVKAMTIQEIDAMPMRDWMAIPAEERDRLKTAAWNKADATRK